MGHATILRIWTDSISVTTSHADMPSSLIIQLHANDNVVVARTPIPCGTTLTIDHRTFVATQDIPPGHKVAVAEIASSSPVVKYGQIIGYASASIASGDWVHVHNLVAKRSEFNYDFSTELCPAPTPDRIRTFQGYKRTDGQFGTRNYVALISTVNCSATTARYVAAELAKTDLTPFPNVDGIVPLVHKGGCAMSFGGEDHLQLNRTLAGFATHPNIAACLILGLGCETAQASHLQREHGLIQLGSHSSLGNVDRPMIVNIQEVGGVRKTVDHVVGILRDLLPAANDVRREPLPVSRLKVALECGGSDGNSGITANPALGVASDLLVAQGGTVILSETPEIYGAEQMLTKRAVNRSVGEKLLERIRWWEDYAQRHNASIDNNPSVGNKLGGLTTIFEKSLGAIAKAGTTPLQAVYRYAEPINEPGFVIMDSPGFDPASVTGKVASGAQIVVFTTGRGSCFGCKPSPTIKVATNTPMFNRMRDDMDIDAGRILDGTSVQAVGEEIFERIIATASGSPTLSESQGIGDEEFCPWTPGPIF